MTLISLITGVLILEFPSSGTVSNKFSLPVSFQFYPFFLRAPPMHSENIAPEINSNSISLDCCPSELGENKFLLLGPRSHGYSAEAALAS